MGVNDIGMRPPRLSSCLARKEEKAKLPARAPVEHRPLDLVPAGRELALELGYEDPEIWIFGPWVHLRDEQDAHLVGKD
jgi:hypothetical protein